MSSKYSLASVGRSLQATPLKRFLFSMTVKDCRSAPGDSLSLTRISRGALHGEREKNGAGGGEGGRVTH